MNTRTLPNVAIHPLAPPAILTCPESLIVSLSRAHLIAIIQVPGCSTIEICKTAILWSNLGAIRLSDIWIEFVCHSAGIEEHGQCHDGVLELHCVDGIEILV